MLESVDAEIIRALPWKYWFLHLTPGNRIFLIRLYFLSQNELNVKISRSEYKVK